MPDFVHAVTVAVAPDAVFRAITEQEGLAAWWTPDMVAEPRVGSTLRAGFGGGRFVIAMDVTALEPTHKVEWIPRQGAPEWIGTRVVWELAPVERGTNVVFAQRGFAPTAVGADGYLLGANGWIHYLASLKAYLETGTGDPDSFRANA
jgi:uncharacterized protein YndB with AHSA1/START domain